MQQYIVTQCSPNFVFIAPPPNSCHLPPTPNNSQSTYPPLWFLDQPQSCHFCLPADFYHPFCSSLLHEHTCIVKHYRMVKNRKNSWWQQTIWVSTEQGSLWLMTLNSLSEITSRILENSRSLAREVLSATESPSCSQDKSINHHYHLVPL